MPQTGPVTVSVKAATNGAPLLRAPRNGSHFSGKSAPPGSWAFIGTVFSLVKALL